MTGRIGLSQRTQSLSLDFPRSTLTPSVSCNNHAKITFEILNIKYHPAWISNYTTSLMEVSERLSPDIKRSVLSLSESPGAAGDEGHQTPHSASHRQPAVMNSFSGLRSGNDIWRLTRMNTAGNELHLCPC